MATLLDSEINDLVVGTLQELDAPNFTQIAQTLQDYSFFNTILREDKVQFRGGASGFKTRIMVTTTGQAVMTGLYDTDQVNVGETLKEITVPWRRTKVPYAYERREILEQAGDGKLTDLLTLRRTDALISLAELFEAQHWSKPVDSTNETDAFGVPYWIVKWPTGTTTPGFTGSDAAGFTSGPGGLSSATYTNWKNYAGQYLAVSKTDLISKWRTAFRKTKFRSPIGVESFRNGVGARYKHYMNETTLNAIELVAENQNENLGPDIASMDGVTTFKGGALIYVSYLDADTGNPVYSINSDTFYPFVLDGDYLRETEPDKAPNQHNVWQVWIDTSWNEVCINRRCNSVLSYKSSTDTTT